jgi:hypothetical protein
VNERFVAVRGESVHTVEVDGEAVLLDEARNRLHVLNATGALVWACLDGVSRVGEIVTDLSEGLGVPYDVALDDTLAVVRTLGAEGLLANVAPPRRHDEAHSYGRTETPEPADPRFVPEPPNP